MSKEDIAMTLSRPTDTTTPTAPKAPIRHLNQIDLSRRWRISERTLERWRWKGLGPAWLKIGGRVVYRLEDVEHYETQQTRLGGNR